jgi:uncharacterized protein YndB with AHSA1/START domain
MSFAIAGIAVLVATFAAIWVVGSRMPREHQGRGTRRVAASPAAVFAALTDVAGMPKWRPDVKTVEVLPSVGDQPSFRETNTHGTMTFVISESVPGRRVVTTIVDEGQPFGGRWTFDLEPESDGAATRVTITEDGWVNPPVFRFLSRYVFGHAATIEAYLGNLEKRFRRN